MADAPSHGPSLARPLDSAPIHASTGRNHNPGNGTWKWKISVQPPGARRAACPKCKHNFDQGELRLGSAAGNKSQFHMGCLDADLPPVEGMAGWDSLSPHEQGQAHSQYTAFRTTRGGDAESAAPKRARQERPTRQIQMLLPFASDE